MRTTAGLRGSPGGERRFAFAAVICAAGPLRAQCVAGAGGTTVALHPQEALLQAARALQASSTFADARPRRTDGHRIARLVQLSVRQARYVGRAKTLVQPAMAAAVSHPITLLAVADAARRAPVAAGTLLSVLVVALATLLARPWLATGPRPSDAVQPLRARTHSASTTTFRPTV